MKIPSYQIVLILVLVCTFFEIVFERIFKIRSRIQNHITNRHAYMMVSIIFIFIISVLADIFITNSIWSQIANIVIIALMVYLMNSTLHRRK